MYRIRALAAIILVAGGLVWTGQGLGLIRSSSFMTDDVRWAWIGLACIVGGLVLGVVEIRRRRRAA